MNHIAALFGSSISRDNGGRSEYEQKKIEQAQVIMKPFVLRRLKKDVLRDLPNKTEVIEMCVMSKAQARLYQEQIESFKREIKESKEAILENDDSFAAPLDEDAGLDNGGLARKGAANGSKQNAKAYHHATEPSKRGTAMLMAMRRLANHKLLARNLYTTEKLLKMASILKRKDESHYEANEQYVFEDLCVMHDFELHILCKTYDVLRDFKLKDDDICDSGKFKFLDQLLPEFKRKAKKCLIFSQFTMMLDILEEYLRIRDISFVRLDGSTRISERLELIDAFNEDKNIVVFLLSTKAGGLGINLTSANTVLIHDIDYNPMNDLQAQDRSYRIGQTKDVTCYKLISKDSIEEGILDATTEKLKLGQDMSGSTSGTVAAKDLRSLLRINLKL